ncbi:hypothetical protein PZH32_00495 [Adlercreutzia equolifaciens]|uniref:zinc ribbon domain-containing protein n=1 Tax=Adlercreutzia equolifaciens TaxID=446660 RepID=UPI0023B0DA1B|nr:hypothetical protein [Adlercreutzia equolifaciens]MDE8701439.1 hypothetical protein [Adlercreutzia equolifaciens]
MNCQYCGQPLSEDMLFCTRCGRPTPLAEETETAFVESPETTGPLPRLDEEGNPVVEAAEVDETVAEAGEGEATAEAESDDAGVQEEGIVVAVNGDVAKDTSDAEPSDEVAAATLADDEAAADVHPDDGGQDEAAEESDDALVAPAPVIAVHKSRVPLVIVSIIVALVVGCACFVGGLYVAKMGLIEGFQPAAETAPAPEPSAEKEAAAAAAAAAEEEAAAEAEALEEDAPGAATAEEVAVAVQEGWEAMIADDFNEEACNTWMQTVIALQPTGVVEAYDALVGVEGDSLLPLYLYDGLPEANKDAIEGFLQGDSAAVAVKSTVADKTSLASLNVYFGDLGQSVAGQVDALDLPFDASEAFVLGLEIAPTGESSQSSETLAINEGTHGYMIYEFQDRWYLLAAQLERVDV